MDLFLAGVNIIVDLERAEYRSWSSWPINAGRLVTLGGCSGALLAGVFGSIVNECNRGRDPSTISKSTAQLQGAQCLQPTCYRHRFHPRSINARCFAPPPNFSESRAVVSLIMNQLLKKGQEPKVVRVLARLTGGPARQACLLHERLTRYFATRLVTGGLPPGEHDMSYLLSSEENVFRIQEMSREVSFWADTLAFCKLVRFIWRERPDIVHTHTAKAGALGRLAAWLARVPVIVHTYHGHVFHSYFGPIKTWTYTMIERLLGCIT